MKTKNCHYCQEEIEGGRSDKKYCNAHCRSAGQYQAHLKNEPFYLTVKKALSTNRTLLKEYNRSGLAKTRLSELVKKGFQPKFFTHYWKNKKGETYLFVYEFGYLIKEEYGVKKAILVKWQEYMK